MAGLVAQCCSESAGERAGMASAHCDNCTRHALPARQPGPFKHTFMASNFKGILHAVKAGICTGRNRSLKSLAERVAHLQFTQCPRAARKWHCLLAIAQIRKTYKLAPQSPLKAKRRCITAVQDSC